VRHPPPEQRIICQPRGHVDRQRDLPRTAERAPASQRGKSSEAKRRRLEGVWRVGQWEVAE
jgi:hypothetical protein